MKNPDPNWRKSMPKMNFFFSVSLNEILIWILVCDTHCREISIYVFPENKLPGLSLNFYIHVSVSDLYIPTVHLFSCSRIADRGYI
jgi:hypothetical protein